MPHHVARLTLRTMVDHITERQASELLAYAINHLKIGRGLPQGSEKHRRGG